MTDRRFKEIDWSRVQIAHEYDPARDAVRMIVRANVDDRRVRHYLVRSFERPL